MAAHSCDRSAFDRHSGGIPRRAALGLRTPEASHLTVWRRVDQPGITLPVPHLRGQRVTADVLYPRSTGAGATWEPAAGTLSVELPRFPSACLISLRAR
jgi:hypothetical protein